MSSYARWQTRFALRQELRGKRIGRTKLRDRMSQRDSDGNRFGLRRLVRALFG